MVEVDYKTIFLGNHCKDNFWSITKKQICVLLNITMVTHAIGIKILPTSRFLVYSFRPF